MRVLHGSHELLESAGEVLGTSDWLRIKQERIDQFAVATEDYQWIHRPRASEREPGRSEARSRTGISR